MKTKCKECGVENDGYSRLELDAAVEKSVLRLRARVLVSCGHYCSIVVDWKTSLPVKPALEMLGDEIDHQLGHET